MKKSINILIALFAPFLFTWAVYLLTGFAFNIQSFFTSGLFICLASVYYFVLSMAAEILIFEN